MQLIYDKHDGTRAKAYPESGLISIKEGGLREIIYLPPGGNMVIQTDKCYTYIERTNAGLFISTSCGDNEDSSLCRHFSAMMDKYCPVTARQARGRR